MSASSIQKNDILFLMILSLEIVLPVQSERQRSSSSAVGHYIIEKCHNMQT